MKRGSPPGRTHRFGPKMGVLMHIFTFWCEKISLDNDARQWVVDGHWQSKKEWGFALLTKRRQIKIWVFGHGFPTQNISKKNSAVKENVWLVPMRIFGLFYFSRQIKSNLGKIASYTSHNFLHLTISLPLSLILREHGRRDLPSFSLLMFCGYWQCTAQIHKLKFKSEYYLRKQQSCQKCKHRQSHFDFRNTDSKKVSTWVSLLKRNNLLAKLCFSKNLIIECLQKFDFLYVCAFFSRIFVREFFFRKSRLCNTASF